MGHDATTRIDPSGVRRVGVIVQHRRGGRRATKEVYRVVVRLGICPIRGGTEHQSFGAQPVKHPGVIRSAVGRDGEVVAAARIDEAGCAARVARIPPDDDLDARVASGGREPDLATEGVPRNGHATTIYPPQHRGGHPRAEGEVDRGERFVRVLVVGGH